MYKLIGHCLYGIVPWTRVFLISFFIWTKGAPVARADWINLTGAETSPNIAEIYIKDDHVQVNLEVYIGDIPRFEDLVPDDWLKEGNRERSSQPERLQRFSEHGLQFITDDGERLVAQLKTVEPRLRKDRYSPFAGMINPMTRQRVPEAPWDKRVLYLELVYPFNDRPAALTMSPPLDEQGRATVTIGFIVYHKSVPVIDFRYLGQSAELALDWDDPWYSRFANPNLKRHHKDAMMSYLYVEPNEVRHELLVRVRDMAQWMDLALTGEQYIEVGELEALKQRVGEFLLTRNQVKVDGVARKPILDRSNYVKVGLSGIQLLEKPQRLEINTAIIGVIITYLTEGIPQQVTVDWELFTEGIQRVPATAIDPAGPLLTYVSPDDQVHTWTNFLKNYQVPTVAEVRVAEAATRWQIPLVSVLLLVTLAVMFYVFRGRMRQRKPVRWQVGVMTLLAAGAVAAYPYGQLTVARPALLIADMSAEDAKQTLRDLLKNVYRAFDFRDEEDVYDKLALSVSGDLLADIYLQNRRSFAVQKAGGAQAKVKDIEILAVDAQRLEDQPLAYALHGKWTASGSVGHWGHIHVRQNYYEAVITAAADQGRWKITGLELLEEKRLDPGQQATVGNQAQ